MKIYPIIPHDSLPGYVANEHIDHTAVTMTAGTGLTGGGTIASDRTFNVAANLATINALAVTDGNFIVGNGSTWVAESGNTARTSLGLGTGNSPTFSGIIIDDGQAYLTLLAEVDPQTGDNATLTLKVARGVHTLTINDSLSLGDWFDQNVKSTASPTFVGLTLSGAIATPTTITASGLITGDSFITGGDIGVAADTDLLQLADGALTVNGTVTLPSTNEINFRDTDISIGSTLFDGILDISADDSVYFFYDNADVGDAVDGQSLYIYRRAGEYDKYIRFYTDQDGISKINASYELDLGVVADTDLLQLATNALTVNGALTATGAITGGSLVTGGAATIGDGLVVNADHDAVNGITIEGYSDATTSRGGYLEMWSDSVDDAGTKKCFMWMLPTGTLVFDVSAQSSWLDIGQLWLNPSSGAASFASANFTISSTGAVLVKDKIAFTQADLNEYIDSLADGYMDYGATTGHRFNNEVVIAGAISSATLTITASSDALDVSGVNTVFVNISGDIILGGLIGGVDGQEVKFAIIGNFTNHVRFEHQGGIDGSQDFINHTSLDEDIDHGGCVYVCNGTDWYDISHAKHIA